MLRVLSGMVKAGFFPGHGKVIGITDIVFYVVGNPVQDGQVLWSFGHSAPHNSSVWGFFYLVFCLNILYIMCIIGFIFMDLSVITVTWNSEKRIAGQILSVAFGYRNITCEQIVVDNASKDDTVNIIKKTSPTVRLIESGKNLGFAMANNLAVKESSGHFILFLNPDTRVEPGVLDRAVNWMYEHKDVGIMGCRLVKADGKPNLKSTPRRFPTLKDQLVIVFKLHHFFPKILDKYLMRNANLTREMEVDSVQGSCLFLRREIVEKLGRAFDERFFIWFEDVDLCREVKKLGYKVIYQPAWECIDYGGESFAKRNLLWKQFQFIRSMIRYFKKWGI